MTGAPGSLLVAVLVVALAGYRITRLVAVDSISDAFRGVVYRWAYDHDDPRKEPVPRRHYRTRLYELLICPHCLGVWLVVATACAWEWGGNGVRVAVAFAAAVGVQSLLASYAAAVAEPEG